MKQFKSKILILLTFILIITAVPVISVQAASKRMSISISNTTVNVGDTFTVTVSCSCDVNIMEAYALLKYDPSLVSSGSSAGSIIFRFSPDHQDEAKSSYSQTYTFTAKEVGSVSFSLTDAEVYTVDSNQDRDEVSIANSGASVKISAKGSSNANLSSLKLSAGSLSPSFSNDVTSYTVSVPNSVTSISISAVAADAKAKVSVSGSNEVPEGDSSRVIIVTAEDGTVKKFTININRAAGVKITPVPSPTAPTTPTHTSGILPVPTTDPNNLPDELEVTAGGAILVISDKPADVTLPAGFTEIQYTYRDRPVWAAQNGGQNLLILYLQDQANEKSGFYVYDETSDEFSKYIILYTQANSYTLLQRPETVQIPNGYVEKTAVIDNENVTVWVPVSMKYMDAEVCEFYLVYAMAQDGNKGFYVYDTVEKTFQRFSSDISMSTEPNASDDSKATPAPDTVVNPDDTYGEEDGIWSGIKSFFSRIFTGGAKAIDWFLFGFLAFVLVLMIVLVIFIIYATQKHKEESEDEDFPLAVNGDKEKSFRKANLFHLEDEVQEDAAVPEEYDISEQGTEDGQDTDFAQESPLEVTEPEPESVPDISESESESEPVSAPISQENSVSEAVDPDPFDFKIEDLKKDDTKTWNFDDEIGADFFDDSEN